MVITLSQGCYTMHGCSKLSQLQHVGPRQCCMYCTPIRTTSKWSKWLSGLYLRGVGWGVCACRGFFKSSIISVITQIQTDKAAASFCTLTFAMNDAIMQLTMARGRHSRARRNSGDGGNGGNDGKTIIIIIN